MQKDESRKGPTPEEIKEITGELTSNKREPLPDISNEDVGDILTVFEKKKQIWILLQWLGLKFQNGPFSSLGHS